MAGDNVNVADDGTVRVKNALRRGESVRAQVKPAAGRIAALRVDFSEGPVLERERKRNKANPPLRFAATVRAPGSKDRKIEVIFADATAKEPDYENGAEVIGIGAGWKIPTETGGLPRTGVWLPAQPLTLAEGEELIVTITGEGVPPFRVFTSPFAAVDATSTASVALLGALRASEPRARAQQELLVDTWLLSTAYSGEAFKAHHQLAARIRETRGGRAWTQVTQPAEPIAVRVLPRGNWLDETGPIVLPATPSFLPSRRESAADQRLTRLDLARWIVAPENPITARTVTNRLWAMFFGIGLSAKLDDLGSQGEAPSHPELLEWLASELRESGWDLRHIMRLIVTSATYRQDSNLPPAAREADPANRLLSAQNPRRLEAEFVRDNALFIAGGLNVRDIGGPSVKPYQPAGYYAALQFPDRNYQNSADDEQWRRGVYMHWQRTFLHPMLANFDAPARDECAAQRIVSNTPQQALTLLNDPTFVEAARLFAGRLHSGAKADDARLRLAYRLALSRDPTPAELASLTRFLATQRETYRANPADAAKLLRVGLAPAPAGDAAELAAWTSVARVILNSHEAITRY